VHWVLYGLPAASRSLPENLTRSEELPGGAKQGMTDFKRISYGGPRPPPGRPHRYFFRLYALDTELVLKSGATKPQLLQAMEGHVLAEDSLMGVYQRRR
jgi:Raf kinase inhibitor-like YbhB/YbcL family protein